MQGKPSQSSNKKFHCVECENEFIKPKKVPLPDDKLRKLIDVDACPKCYSANLIIVKVKQGKAS